MAAWLVAGQSLAEQQHTMNVLRGGEALVGPVLLLAMFAGSLIIGLRALSPVEQSRRRQLERHRGRLARAAHPAERDQRGDRHRAERAAASRRLPGGAAAHRVTRASGCGGSSRTCCGWPGSTQQPPPPGAEPLDLCTIAGQCADRFQAVAHSQSLDIAVTAPRGQAAWISAPPEWIDRLAGSWWTTPAATRAPAGACGSA